MPEDITLSVESETYFNINRSANDPVYILIVEHPEKKDKLIYFKAPKYERMAASVKAKGTEITKTQFNSLEKDPNTEIETKQGIREREFPWHTVRRIDNLSYRPKTKENK